MLSKAVGGIGSLIYKIVKIIGRIILRFFHLFVILFFVIIIIGLASLIAGGIMGAPLIEVVSPDPTFSGFIGYYCGILSLMIIPALFIMSYIIRRVWGYRSPLQYSRAFYGLWIVSFGVFLTTAWFTARCFTQSYSSTEKVATIKPEVDVFELKSNLADNEHFNGIKIGGLFNTRDGEVVYYNQRRLRLTVSPDDKIHLYKTIFSRGSSVADAQRRAQLIVRQHQISPTEIEIDGSYTINKQKKFRGQELKYELQLPINQKVKSSMSDWLTQGPLRKGTVYIMTEDGLEPIDSLAED